MTHDERFGWKTPLKSALFALCHPRLLLQWTDYLRHPAMTSLYEVQPRLIDKPLRPYLHAAWTASQRVQALTSHYEWLRSQFPWQTRQRMFEGPHPELARWVLGDESQELSLQIGYNGAFEREGDLTVTLVSRALSAHEGQLPCTPQWVAAVTFSIVMIGHRRVLCVGCVQARHDSATLHRLRHLTRQMHGQRPKVLLMEAVKLLARTWHLPIYAIDPALHPYTSARYRLSRRKRLAVSTMRRAYLDLWAELGGSVVPGGWYELPTWAHQHLPAEIPSRKRGLYARRSDLMDSILGQAWHALARLHVH